MHKLKLGIISPFHDSKIDFHEFIKMGMDAVLVQAV